MSRLMLAFALTVAATIGLVQGQAPDGEWMPGSSRILVADNTPGSCHLTAVDLPSFNVTHRISVPGPVSSIGLTEDNEYAGVFRSSGGNDQHWVTFVHTGLKPMSGVVAPRASAPPTVTGYMRPMVTSKSLLVYNGSDKAGGVENGDSLVYHPRWRTNLMYSEAHGFILAYNAKTTADPASPPRITTRATIPPGHFHLTPVSDFVAAPHTTGSLALLVNRTGSIVYAGECGSCHGSHAYEASRTMSVALYGCNTSVMAVTIDTSSPTPKFTATSIEAKDPRIGSFVAGAPGVFWSAAHPPVNATSPNDTTGDVYFYRTDVRGDNFTITKVDHPGSDLGFSGFVLRALGLPDKQRMLAIHRVGLLVMYNGETGDSLGNVLIKDGGFKLDDTSPFLTTKDNQIFISVPSDGVLHEIDANYTSGSMSVRRTVEVEGVLGTLVVADQAKL